MEFSRTGDRGGAAGDDVPSLHDRKLHATTTEHVLEALKPIWNVKPITASRTRQRIERLMEPPRH